MSDDDARAKLRKQIYERMLSKETEELLKIWWKDDRSEWSDIGYEVIEEILLQRLGEIPAKPQRLDEHESEPNDDEPYHNETKLLRIAVGANTLSWIMLTTYLLIFIGRVVLEIKGNSGPLSLDFYQVWAWFSFLSTPALGLTYFLILQAISEGIYMLMDLEENGLQVIRSRQ